jgi:hypothetical protein
MAEATGSERLKTTGRNDPCPCGSGKKYKKCHLSEDQAQEHEVLLKAQEEAREKASQEKSGDTEKRPAGKPNKGDTGRGMHKPGGAKGANQITLPRKASR